MTATIVPNNTQLQALICRDNAVFEGGEPLLVPIIAWEVSHKSLHKTRPAPAIPVLMSHTDEYLAAAVLVYDPNTRLALWDGNWQPVGQALKGVRSMDESLYGPWKGNTKARVERSQRRSKDVGFLSIRAAEGREGVNP